MTSRRRVWHTTVLGLFTMAMWEPPVAAPQPSPPVSERHLVFALDERGNRHGSSLDPSALAISLEKATDVFIVVHDWQRSAEDAECASRRFVAGLAEAGTKRRDITPQFVTVHWPSTTFPVHPDLCPARDREIKRLATTTALATSDPATVAQEFDYWVRTAFPSAFEGRGVFPGFFAGFGGAVAGVFVDRASFAAERLALDTLLAENASRPTLSDAASDQLMRTVATWFGRRAPAQGADRNRGDEMTLRAVQAAPARWLVPRRSALDWLRAISLRGMMERADGVGRQGVHPLLRALQPLRQRGVRLHLIGAGLGARAAASAVVGAPPEGPAFVDSLILLQGTLEPAELRGRYAGIFADELTELVVATHSSLDGVNRNAFSEAASLGGGADRPVGSVPSLGGVGFAGVIDATPGSLLRSSSLSLDRAEDMTVFDIDAHGVVLDHWDVFRSEVFELVWAAATATSP